MVSAVKLDGRDSMDFQYSLCRVVLMVAMYIHIRSHIGTLSVLALSSRFDGHYPRQPQVGYPPHFQYSLCRVVLMVCGWLAVSCGL